MKPKQIYHTHKQYFKPGAYGKKLNKTRERVGIALIAVCDSAVASGYTIFRIQKLRMT